MAFSRVGPETLRRIDAGDAPATQKVLADFGPAAREEQRLVLDAVAAHAAGGSAPALELLLQLVDTHALDRSSIRRLIINDSDVEDAHQDVLIALARSIGTFRGDAAFTTWLHTIARNTAVAHLRRRKDAEQLHTDLDITDAARLSSLIATRSVLRDAVNDLPDPYREAIVLRDVQHKTYKEIATQLGIEMNTVKSRISRGRALVAGSSHLDLDSALGDNAGADAAPEAGSDG